MHVAIDISPLESGHKVRGVGFYVKHLKDAFVEFFPEHSYTFFGREDLIPSSVDIVHYPYFDPFALSLPSRNKFPVVVTVHDLIPLVFPEHFPAGIKGNVKWFIQKKRLSYVNAIVADSEASRKDILTYAGVSLSKVSVAYLAAGREFKHIKYTKEEIKKLRDRYRLPEKFVLYVGDGTWNKNVSRLVEACIMLDVSLVLVGKVWTQEDFDRDNRWNDELMKVEALTKDHPTIIRLGFVTTDELVMLYNIAVMFVFPSVYEGFGMPPLEAMSCGCPVIMTKESCMPEIGGDAALYVDNAYSVDSFARAIKMVWKDESLREKLIKKGFENVKRFNWKRCAQETIEVYQKAIRSK